MAGELLPELERRSGLEARRPPRLARRSRAELEAFLNDELAEQLPPDEAEALGATYARLGLVPDTVDLEATLRDLYLEQVVGYYDPEADTLFVLEDVPPAEARMVLVHELVHALQDQRVDLDSLTDALREQNDRSAAARAAIEGQATLVMAEWAVARSTGSDVDLTTMPGIAEKFAEVAAGGAADNMPSFSAAPRVVRETLTFPYVGGLGYMQALWRRDEGRPALFGSRLPASTEQVIHPERALGDEPDGVRARCDGDVPVFGVREPADLHARPSSSCVGRLHTGHRPPSAATRSLVSRNSASLSAAAPESMASAAASTPACRESASPAT
jgi:hypothetical protein